jgi:hypothetical protein
VPEDYAFQAQGPDGDQAEARLSELFVPPSASGSNAVCPPGGAGLLSSAARGNIML